MMKEFGLIGKSLRHSFSATFFTEKFVREHVGATYSLFQLENIDAFPALVSAHNFQGLNVTIPYKETIIPYLDELNSTAKAIGAVNVIKFTHQKMIGYNTDSIGFMQAIKPIIANDLCKKALILGTGGAAKAVNYALCQMGYDVTFASRKKRDENTISYQEIELPIYSLIVNATPVGMYPETEICPNINYNQLTSKHILFDCIYNPQETLFLSKGKAQGATTINGMNMLINQAEAAWDIWNN